MASPVIRIDSISKMYRLGQVGTGSLAHDINRWWYRLRGKEDPYLKVGQRNDRAKKHDPKDQGSLPRNWVYALRDVSFDVAQGEVLGIIGTNGAGKSTLLKILSRVTAPTLGTLKVKGRIASLLEVGTGFHPELTGRENIYLNGAILGMRKREIDGKLDQIADFSECAAYLDTPVKRYSTGMQVRLAFAVAAHLDPEILIVDEVLAVGDAAFQRKCMERMEHISAKEGKTILFVSHSMSAVQKFCTNCLMLSQGTVAAHGPVQDVSRLYLQDSHRNPNEDRGDTDYDFQIGTWSGDTPSTTWAYDQCLTLKILIQTQKPLWRPALDLTFYDDMRRRLFSIRTDHLKEGPSSCEGNWAFEVKVDNPGLCPSEILVDAGLREGSGGYLLLKENVVRITPDMSNAPSGVPLDGLLAPRVTSTSWHQAR